MKSKVDKLDVHKLVPVTVDLSKLSDVVNDVVKKDVYNAKIKNIEDKIPDITNLVPNAAVTAVENKIPNIRKLVKKTDYNTKISEIENKIAIDHDHDKHITTQEFNKLTSENYNARLKEANSGSKHDIANFVKKTEYDNRLKDVTTNKN